MSPCLWGVWHTWGWWPVVAQGCPKSAQDEVPQATHLWGQMGDTTVL